MGTCIALPALDKNRQDPDLVMSLSFERRTIDEGRFPAQINVHEKYEFDVSGLHGRLEEGASGRVVKGIESNNKRNKVAIKIMPKQEELGNVTPKSLFQNEVDILRRIKHKNIVKLMDIGEDEENYYVVLSLGKGGDLVGCIFDDDYVITEEQTVSWTRTMLQTLQYLHSVNIVHCDLKPENIVFQSYKGDDDLILIDFGLAKIVEDDEIYNDLNANKWYTAPEIAQKYLNLDKRDTSETPLTGKVWKSADIWAIGIITYLMGTKTLPFFSTTEKKTFEKIVDDELVFPNSNMDEYSAGFRDFVQKALCKNPDQRITINEALKHPWIRGIAPNEMHLNKEAVGFLRQYGYQSKLKKWVTYKITQYGEYGEFGKFTSDDVPKKHFERLNKDNDGFLDHETFTDLLRDIGYDDDMASDEGWKMLIHADLDKDGYVDLGEFKRVWYRKLLYDEQYMNKIWNVCINYNGNDGRRGSNEYIDGRMVQMKFGGDLDEIKEMINEWNDDQDGKLSLNEFKKAMQEYPKKELVYGFIRNMIVYSDINICKEMMIISQSQRSKINNFSLKSLKSHLSSKKSSNVRREFMKINVDDIPTAVIDTILDIYVSFEPML